MKLYATWEEYLNSKQDYYIDEENVADQKVREKIQGFDVIGSDRVGHYQIYQDEKLVGIIDLESSGSVDVQLDRLDFELRILMKEIPMDSEYYAELRLKALNELAEQEDIDRLGRWFELYDGNDSWNGECYDVEGRNLYPVYKQIDEDEFEIIGYEFR